MPQIQQLAQYEGSTITLQGWVANKRSSGKVAFLVLRDGSGYAQCVAELQTVGEDAFEQLKRLTLESAVALTGKVVKDQKQAGGYELQVTSLHVYHIAEEYPLGKKEHGVDFLMNKRHLWLRSSRPWAIMRIRNQVQFSIHNFFQQRGFVQMDAPILTGNACEGTTTLFETEFYKKDNTAYLSQSGQLYGEAMAMAMGKIYTFGPTFRAERSLTPRHLSEFWMIEPEMAFCDLDMDMDLIEEFVRTLVQDVWNNCRTELETLERATTLFENIHKPFPRITYDHAVRLIRGEEDLDGRNAIALLENDLATAQQQLDEKQTDVAKCEALVSGGTLKKGEINYYQSKIDKLKAEIKKLEDDVRNIPQWIESSRNFPPGEDFGSPNEKALTRLFHTPVMVYKWPSDIKAFYMKRYPDDPRYVKGVDLLAPEGFGEIVGGSEREDNFDILHAAIQKHELPMEAFEWYLDLRRFGSVPHAGFGLGFERVIMWLTGAAHIRETIPFPRYYGRLFP
ncbi:MAG: asparagine--tRNA ligase [Chitinophagales bacterium]|nr:asparagine--tRNA ligase [Chitinophagales bacterium]